MKKIQKNPDRVLARSGRNSKIKSTPKVILNRQIKFVKHKNGSSSIKLPPANTLYLERNAKKLGMKPVAFLSQFIQKTNLKYKPWPLK